MENIDRIKETLFSQADKYVIKLKPIGGQSCGIPPLPFRVHHEGLGIDITVSHYRSVHKNKDLAETLFKLTVDEIII